VSRFTGFLAVFLACGAAGAAGAARPLSGGLAVEVHEVAAGEHRSLRDAVPASGHPAMVDALGDTLAAGPYPARIVSLSPNLTEILFALGVDSSRIAGVTRYCDYPPEARERPVVGGIVDPSLERIQALHPDLVLAARGNPVEVLQRIRGLGIPVFAVEDRIGLAGIGRILGQVFALVGPDERNRGRELLGRFRRELDAYRAWSDSLETRPRVYYADPEHLAWTAGPGSHVDDLIRLAGGSNVVREGGAWPQYSAERLVLADPDWVVLALPEGAGREAVLADVRRAPGWNELRAIRQGRICWIDAGVLLRPGPRVLGALETLAACLHPGRRP
jgi:iron complex transport system substrate-binding protein